MGSSSIVIDEPTGELVESSGYLAFGAAENDYRPERWASYRDDHRFTGKEDDVECSIAYFGKRYLVAGLGRWLSPDPLTIHGLGADSNAYAYVHGALLRRTDPAGLQEVPENPPQPPLLADPEQWVVRQYLKPVQQIQEALDQPKTRGAVQTGMSAAALVGSLFDCFGGTRIGCFAALHAADGLATGVTTYDTGVDTPTSLQQIVAAAGRGLGMSEADAQVLGAGVDDGVGWWFMAHAFFKAEMSRRSAVPGDADFVGPHVKPRSWTLTGAGDGAHMVEKASVAGRERLSIFDRTDTPRYYPEGTPENAGQAHLRLHAATKQAGIKLRKGGTPLSDEALLDAYAKAYSDPRLRGIKGTLRTPNGRIVLGSDVTPGEAFKLLREWGKWQDRK
jgi:RHS repeat-associated protein